MLTEYVLLAASECSGTAVVDRVDGRVADVDETWLGVLGVRAGLLLDATSGVNGVAPDVVDDIVMDIEVWMSADIEGISVWLRNRAMF